MIYDLTQVLVYASVFPQVSYSRDICEFVMSIKKSVNQSTAAQLPFSRCPIAAITPITALSPANCLWQRPSGVQPFKVANLWKPLALNFLINNQRLCTTSLQSFPLCLLCMVPSWKKNIFWLSFQCLDLLPAQNTPRFLCRSQESFQPPQCIAHPINSALTATRGSGVHYEMVRNGRMLGATVRAVKKVQCC